MSELRIGIIAGSTRPGRKALAVAEWVQANAHAEGVSFEVVDLADFALPLLDEAVPASMGHYQNEHTKAWAATIDELDGFIFVTPEYNHSLPGALKNALDFVGAEWNNKAAGIVSYGSMGGVRANEHLRQILAELQIADVRQNVLMSIFSDWENFADFTPAAHHANDLAALVGQLTAWAGALKPLRATDEALAA